MMLIAATACSKSDKASSPSDPGEPQASNGMVSGKVVDEHGNPVVGATIYAGHTEWYNTNVIGKTLRTAPLNMTGIFQTVKSRF